MTISSRMLNYLVRHPQKMMDYQLNGRLPRTYEPKSPLIDLLEKLTARERMCILNIRLHPDLGYGRNNQQFHNAEQLYNWLKPQRQLIVGESFPAESWRDKRFNRELYLDDLLAHAGQYPQELLQRFAHLRKKGGSRAGDNPAQSATRPEPLPPPDCDAPDCWLG